MYAMRQELWNGQLCCWLLGVLQGGAQIDSFKFALCLSLGTERLDGAHAMLALNPPVDSHLVDAKSGGGFGLRTKVLYEPFKNVHFLPSYRDTYNSKHRQADLQQNRHAYTVESMELKDRFKLAREHAGLKQQQLAERAGVKQATISDLERGKSQGSNYTARIAAACQVSALWLETGEGTMCSSEHANVDMPLQPYREEAKYPLISWIQAGMWEESCDNFAPGDAEEWIHSDADAGRCGYWLEVKGLSMYSPSGPSFPPTMRILVRPEDFDVISGKFYVARLKSTGETTFKQYVRDSGVGYLAPLNPSFKTIEIDEDVEIIGRVVDGKLPPALF